MSVIIGVLAVLAVTLLVVAFIAWDINSKVILPKIIKEASELSFSKENIGSYLEVLTGIVALLFPISLSIINDAKGDYFNSKEATSVVFNHWTYKSLKFILGFLIVTIALSFFYTLTKFWLFFIWLGMTCSLGMLFFYFKHLQKVIQDFSEMVRIKEKNIIETLLRNG